MITGTNEGGAWRKTTETDDGSASASGEHEREEREERAQPSEMCGRAEIAAVSLSRPGLSRLF